MKTIQKISALLLALSLLTACAPAEDKTTANSGTPKNSSSVTTAAPSTEAPVITTAAEQDNNETLRSAIFEQLAQDDAERAGMDDAWSYVYGGYTLVNGITKDGSRYLANVQRTESITATEAEMAQARETGKLVLDGTEYAYSESEEQLSAWTQGTRDGFYSLGDGVGLILSQDWLTGSNSDTSVFLESHKVGERYVFCLEIGGVTTRLEKVTDSYSVYLDGDMPLTEGPSGSDEQFTLASYLEKHTINPGTICRIQRDAETGSYYIYVDQR